MKHKTKIIMLGILGLLVSPLLGISAIKGKAIVGVKGWSGPQTSTAGTYYDSVGSLTGSALQTKLKSIISSGTSESYDWSRYEAADEAEGQSNSVLLIYSRQVVLKTAHVSGSTGWNREHTYPQSKIGSPAASDNHHIFADDVRTNGIRSNNPFNELNPATSTRVVDSYGNITDNYTSGSYFMPNNLAKGEVARATMYLNTRYGYSVTENFYSVALMLRWHIENPVTNREIYRNNVIHTLQKNRNPFIDKPEYACAIWGSTNSETQNLCATQTQVDVASVSVSPSSGSISLLSPTPELQLNANVLPSNASNKLVSWSSSNMAVATVSNTGNVTAKAVGSTTITATSLDNGAIKGTATINVTNDAVPVTGVTLDDTSFSLSVGTTKKLNETVLPAGATDKSVTWTSSNTAVASVNNGLVTANTVGSATITVKTNDGNKTATASVNVTNAPPAQSEPVTYNFLDKNWSASPTNWTSLSSGFAFDNNRGIQVTGGNITAGNSPYFANVISVILGTAASSGGIGTFSAYIVNSSSAALRSGTKIGNDISVNKPGSTIIERRFDLATPLSGHVQAIADATGSSLYVKYVHVITAAPESANHLSNAELWADTFLEDTLLGCETGSYVELSNVWPSLKTKFMDLSVEAQNIIKGVTPNASGNAIEHAVARYIVIVNEHGLEAFISGVNLNSGVRNNQNSQVLNPAIYMVTGYAFASIVFFAIRKKRTN